MRKFKAQRYAATHARAKPRLTLATDVLPRARLGEHTEKKRGEAMAKKKKQNSASTPATTVLEKLGISFETVSYEHDADHMDKGYGLEGAAKLGVDPHQTFKTLLAEDESTHEIVVGVVPAAGHLDMKALAQAAGLKKCEMADPAKAMRVTGYVTGGISPLGQKVTHRTFIDTSAHDFPTILVSAGNRLNTAL